jgi:LmbE family N-acetylglucosaminyl deacetylase
MTVAVLSPHLDDAVLSAWSALRGEAPVTVVNVFTGLPPAGAAAPWDALTGATDSRARMRERIAEDRAALAIAGVEARSLGLLDAHYRAEPLDSDALREAIASAVDGAAALWAPAGIGGHVDHVGVRDAALALGIPWRMYADLPYAVKFGWPAWVTGEPEDPNLAIDADWRRWLPPGLELEPTVHRLPPPEAELKLRAMRTYATQYAGLTRGSLDHLAHPLVLGYEVSWG